ncbi:MULTISPECIES: Pr6Pr family membrane protein [unclassified Streptomyces]|uniref:Pr6Pr family membrane protein n=1 Tax=unclassified Streptomyces TaxID=2593676 RepID=UPI002E2F5A14|nr:Pr6Pr family membrane protein [Streptomyces sp. NBC_01428]
MITPMPRDIPDLPAIPGISPPFVSFVPATAVATPTRRPFTAVFRILVALAAAAGVAIDVKLGSPVRVLSYFTIQTNLLVALVFAASARRAWSARRPLPGVLTGGTLIYISITGLVYHLLLANESSPFSMTGGGDTLSGWHAAANHLLHTVTPIAVVLDWLLLTRPAPLAFRNAVTWLLYPLAYLVFSLARGAAIPPGNPVRYLYPFVDVERHGYAGVLGNTAILGVAFYALALLIVAVDHVRPDPVRRRVRGLENRISSPGTSGLK